MLGLLAASPMTGSQLARALDIPRTRAHYHLNILREASLVEFQHEQLKGGIVEKYYRAVARELRTDHVVDRSRLAAGAASDEAGTGEMMRDIMLAMLDVLRADLLLPQALPGLAQSGFNWQDELVLTPSQTGDLINALRAVLDQFSDLSRQNRAASGAGHRLLLTSLLTPVLALQFDAEPEAREPRSAAVRVPRKATA
jgi:DNA-binding transcriptional ArsR family regulator